MTVCYLVGNSGTLPGVTTGGLWAKDVSRYWELALRNGDGQEVGWGSWGPQEGGKQGVPLRSV